MDISPSKELLYLLDIRHLPPVALDASASSTWNALLPLLNYQRGGVVCPKPINTTVIYRPSYMSLRTKLPPPILSAENVKGEEGMRCTNVNNATCIIDEEGGSSI